MEWVEIEAQVVADKKAVKPLLPEEQWHLQIEGDVLCAGIYEYPPGYTYYAAIDLRDLPNDFISMEDVESARAAFNS